MRTFSTTLLAVIGHLTAQTNAMGLDTQSMTSVIDTSILEYKFSTKRCSAKKLSNPKKNKCEDWCTDDNEPTIGCSWSYPIGDELKGKSEDAACRCNQRMYKYEKQARNLNKCDNSCEADEKCYKSWPFYIKKKDATSDEKSFRCKGPLEPPTLDEFQCQFIMINETQLCMHNQARAGRKDTPEMRISYGQLAVAAQAWSETMASEGRMYHSDQTDHGENLAVSTNLNPTDSGWAAKLWYEEIKFYNFADPKYSSDVGHFTQMVWTDTDEVGCGAANGACPWDNTETCAYVTCRYSSPGNVDVEEGKDTELAEHVKPIISPIFS